MKTKLYTSKECREILNALHVKTKLTPNILCRYGVALSLKIKDPLKFDYDRNGQEFNRNTLTGDLDLLFRELIKQHESKYIDDDSYFDDYLKAHLERGVRLLNSEIEVNTSFDGFIAEFFNNERGGTI